MGIEIKFRQAYGKLLWKTEEAKRLATIVFWNLTIVGIYLPMISHELDGLGFHINGWLLFILLNAFCLLAILLFGHILDKTKLWRDDWVARISRNPFETYKFRPKEKLLIENQIKIFEGLCGDKKKFNEGITELKKWIRDDCVR